MIDKKNMNLTELLFEIGVIKHLQVKEYISEEKSLDIIKLIEEKVELEE